VVFFGLLSYFPNVDGVTYLVQEIWLLIAEAHPKARLKIIGGQAPRSLQALVRPGVELTGFVSDLRPHLAEAAAVVVPLRLGGGTRLKIVEAKAMGKAIVSSTLGAEGIEAVPGRDLLIEDQPAAFADAGSRLLASPAWRRASAGPRDGWQCNIMPGAGQRGRLRASTVRSWKGRRGNCHPSRIGAAAPRLPEGPANKLRRYRNPLRAGWLIAHCAASPHSGRHVLSRRLIRLAGRRRERHWGQKISTD
jgi:glycosyltransferase involved in cell wall biosynthesis